MPDFTPVVFDETKTWGTDVSFYQDDNGTPQGINFAKMKAEGAKFVYIRAGQNLWKDPDFETNVTNARAAGLPWGSYWYLDCRVSIRAQAKIFGDLMTQWKPDLLPAVDFEQKEKYLINGTWKRLELSDLSAFLTYFKEYYVLIKKPLIYTGFWFWKERGSLAASWKEYPLWIANYGVEKPNIPAPWADYKMWQFTESGPGKRLGVESNAIDMNYMNGELPWVFAPPAPPPPPNPEDIMYNVHTEVPFKVIVNVATIDPNAKITAEIKRDP
jgi:GH25 family lysozyme M1 (1,4-beta-N-acetylmuramidase)